MGSFILLSSSVLGESSPSSSSSSSRPTRPDFACDRCVFSAPCRSDERALSKGTTSKPRTWKLPLPLPPCTLVCGKGAVFPSDTAGLDCPARCRFADEAPPTEISNRALEKGLLWGGSLPTWSVGAGAVDGAIVPLSFAGEAGGRILPDRSVFKSSPRTEAPSLLLGGSTIASSPLSSALLSSLSETGAPMLSSEPSLCFPFAIVSTGACRTGLRSLALIPLSSSGSTSLFRCLSVRECGETVLDSSSASLCGPLSTADRSETESGTETVMDWRKDCCALR